MEILKFINNLLPTIAKTDVKKAIANVRKELIESTLPPYETASITFSSRKFKAATLQDYNDKFKNECKTDVRGNFIQAITELLKNVSSNLDIIETTFEAKVNGDIQKDDISFYETNTLRYISAVAFSLKYARLLLRWALNEETEASDPDAEHYNEKLTKAEQDSLYQDQDQFFHVIETIGRKKEFLEKAIKSMPGMSVTRSNIEIGDSLGGYGATDPFGSGFIAPRFNIYYIFGRMYAEWQVARYDEAREERKMLEMKLMNLKLVDEGKADARLQQQIDYTADRLNKLNYKINQMEEDYA